jgi:hypothetical protein
MKRLITTSVLFGVTCLYGANTQQKAAYLNIVKVMDPLLGTMKVRGMEQNQAVEQVVAASEIYAKNGGYSYVYYWQPLSVAQADDITDAIIDELDREHIRGEQEIFAMDEDK